MSPRRPSGATPVRPVVELPPLSGPTAAACPGCGRSLPPDGRCAACRIATSLRTQVPAGAFFAAHAVSCALAACVGATLWSFWLTLDADMFTGDALTYDRAFRGLIVQSTMLVTWFCVVGALARARTALVLGLGGFVALLSAALSAHVWDVLYWLW